MNLSLFSYVLAGIVAYGIYRLLRNNYFLWAGMIIGGSIIFLLIDFLKVCAGDTFYLYWPGWFAGIMGILFGLILWGVLKLNLFAKPGFRAISTLSMGLAHALLCFFLYKLLVSMNLIQTAAFSPVSFLYFLLIGFLSMFGFTFLQRKEK